MRWDAEHRARAGLAAVAGGTADRALARLVLESGAVAVWESIVAGSDDSRWSVRAKTVDLTGMARQCEQLGLVHLVPGDPGWPDRLGDLDTVELSGMGGSPWGLWVAGRTDLSTLCRDAAAVVGSRAATQYGEWAAGEIAAGLASDDPRRRIRQVAVVSGGAYGIDAAAHRGALGVGGPTVAVLAGGLDEFYPKGNVGMLRAVRERGAVVSEVPPGTPPTRAAFLARNRLIAALTGVTVLVEAASRSGAQNTVAWAQSMGRAVAAVPGPVSSDRSLTPHRLIRSAEAVLVTSASEVVELLGPLAPAQEAAPALPGLRVVRELDGLEPRLRQVREALRARGGTQVDEVVARTGLGVPECLSRLGELEDWGWVTLFPDGSWGLCRPQVR